jgi:hypothetical protein
LTPKLESYCTLMRTTYELTRGQMCRSTGYTF